MTLLDILPSLRLAALPSRPADGCADVWPVNTHFAVGGRLSVAGVPLCEVADQYGTPVHVLDENDFRTRARAYRSVFSGAEIAYAAKALLTKAVADWVIAEGLSLSVSSSGEIALALAAGVDPGRMILHGNGKSCDDLRYAVAARVGHIVVDSHTEITLLSAQLSARQRVLLRVGADDNAAGFAIGSDRSLEAARRIVADPHLELVGLHTEIDGQCSDPERYGDLVTAGVIAISQINAACGAELHQLDIGGGQEVAHRFGDPALDLRQFGEAVDSALYRSEPMVGTPRPHIIVEPGRSIAAQAGVTVYRVVAVRRTEYGTRVVVDADLSDTPSDGVAANRTVALVNRHPAGRVEAVTVMGRTPGAEALARDVRLPADLHPGDVLAVACTGAYHHSTASNARMTRRAPIIAVADGRSRQIVRRETIDDLMARDLG
ncbi:diaminopimelate decarboxylase family protein [Jongsikchunia kroppenstedtii]|uniref:diaminopimelate decarboxylase family protein n=1 Tax=Jongsikchunia kroppenstedtii TaxID=1121721 RepID=UPI000399B3A2|nr:hypothetical protein [Jongsikchunia kroppenstedtii]